MDYIRLCHAYSYFFPILYLNIYKCQTFLHDTVLPQEQRSIQLAVLQWHAEPIHPWQRAVPQIEENHPPPALQSNDIWLWHCSAGAQWTSAICQYHTTHLPTRFLPCFPSRHVLLGHRLGRSPRRRYYKCNGDSLNNCSHFKFNFKKKFIYVFIFWWPTLFFTFHSLSIPFPNLSNHDILLLHFFLYPFL